MGMVGWVEVFGDCALTRMHTALTLTRTGLGFIIEYFKIYSTRMPSPIHSVPLLVRLSHHQHRNLFKSGCAIHICTKTFGKICLKITCIGGTSMQPVGFFSFLLERVKTPETPAATDPEDGVVAWFWEAHDSTYVDGSSHTTPSHQGGRKGRPGRQERTICM